MLTRIINRIKLFLPSNPRKVFKNIYKKNYWGSKESVSGPGSTIETTANLRRELPKLLKSIPVKSLLDAPCGDLNWISKTDLKDIQYTGADIVPELIENNKKKFPEKTFLLGNIITDDLPAADLVLCRDCFIHLRNDDVTRTIKNFQRCGIKYLLTTTYSNTFNKKILTGHFRPINLELPPFNLPEPIKKFKDYGEGEREAFLGLWLLSEIKL